MEPFPLKILEADRPFYEGMCLSLTVPTLDGEYGILAHHSNLILTIVPGALRFTLSGAEQTQLAAVSGGLAKVENGAVLLLVDTLERPEEIDVKQAEANAAHARELLLQKRSVWEYHVAQAALARATNRLRFKQKGLHG